VQEARVATDADVDVLRALAMLISLREPVYLSRRAEGRKGVRTVLTFEVDTSQLRQAGRQVRERMHSVHARGPGRMPRGSCDPREPRPAARPT